jgi:hypothetical protein
MAAQRTDHRHLVGNVCGIIGDRRTLRGALEFKFRFVADHGAMVDGTWMPHKVFYTVAAYDNLARNLMTTFSRHPKLGTGLRLIVIGRIRQDTRQDPRFPSLWISATHAGPELTFDVAAVVPSATAAAGGPGTARTDMAPAS